jgi:AcrR family transcriptional regulator
MTAHDELAGDPLDELSPTARKLVAAARRLLAREGFGALTVESVAVEAGAYRDAVRYHFGGKAALIAAVVDSLAHDQSVAAYAESRRLPAGGPRVHALMTGDRQLAADRAGFGDFFAILPHVVVDDELRRRVAALYDWYRDLYVAAVAEPEEPGRDVRLRRLASLMVAVTDGLAVQKLLDPEGVDLEPLFALWERMLAAELVGRASPEGDEGGE